RSPHDGRHPKGRDEDPSGSVAWFGRLLPVNGNIREVLPDHDSLPFRSLSHKSTCLQRDESWEDLRVQLPDENRGQLRVDAHPQRPLEIRVHPREWRRHESGSFVLQTLRKIRFRYRWSKNSHSITTAPIGRTTGSNDPESRAMPPKKNREI